VTEAGPKGCKAALTVNGEHVFCEHEAGHDGLAHANEAMQAVWCGDWEIATGDNIPRGTVKL